MNITDLVTDPLTVYEGSFCSEDFRLENDWKLSIGSKLKALTDFSSCEELLAGLESTFNIRFASNSNHLISSLMDDSASELLGALLMAQAWIRKHASLPSILFADELYYFMTPKGDVIQVNSNKRKVLGPTEKFNLFNKQPVKFEFAGLVKHYYETVCEFFIKKNLVSSLKTAQTSMINMDPRDAKWFARRGLLLKSIGEFSLALSDLKRFLSFYSYEEAPEAVKNALIELQGLKATESFNDYSVH